MAGEVERITELIEQTSQIDALALEVHERALKNDIDPEQIQPLTIDYIRWFHEGMSFVMHHKQIYFNSTYETHRDGNIKQYLRALEAGLAAIAIEPVRESAHRTVIEVYIAEGNAGCALRHYHRYRGLIRRELGVGPSREMVQLVHPLTNF